MTGGEKQIYFLRRVDGTGPIKIGCSKRPEARCKQISSDAKAAMRILATAPGDYQDERCLHLKFAADRVKPEWAKSRPYPFGGEKEWFAATPELLALAEKVASSGKLVFRLEDRRDLIFAKRYLNGDTLQAIASDYGLTRERVRQVLRKAGIASLGLRPEHCQKAHDLTPAEIAAAKAYRAGELPKAICEQYGLQRFQLLTVCRRLGIAVRPTGAPFRSDYQETCEGVAKLYREGASLEAIRSEFGWSHITYVYRWLRRAGVKPTRRPDLARLAA